MNDLEFRVLSKADREVKNLLKQTIYGKKGSLQYKHKNTALRISQIKKADYCCFYDSKNTLLANISFIKRNFVFDRKKYLTLYARFYSVKEKGVGIGKKLAHEANKYYNETIHQPALMHSYIEAENKASLKSALRQGCVDFGDVKTNLFSRFFPKNNKAVEIVPEHEKSNIEKLLTEFNKTKSLVNFDHLMGPFNYFVWKENGKIIAGIQGNKVDWELINFPGFQGFMMLNVFPSLPIMKKLFKKQKMSFVAFDHFYCEEGREDILIKLMESVLALFELNMAFYWLDIKDPILAKIEIYKKGGFMSKIQNPPTAKIVCKAHHLSKIEEENLANSTKFISAFDMT